MASYKNQLQETVECCWGKAWPIWDITSYSTRWQSVNHMWKLNEHTQPCPLPAAQVGQWFSLAWVSTRACHCELHCTAGHCDRLAFPPWRASTHILCTLHSIFLFIYLFPHRKCISVTSSNIDANVDHWGTISSETTVTWLLKVVQSPVLNACEQVQVSASLITLCWTVHQWASLAGIWIKTVVWFLCLR